MRKWVLLIVVMACGYVFGTAPTFAQTNENESPLMGMLAKIPDTAGSRAYLTYMDYQALIEVRPGAPRITSLGQFHSYAGNMGKESLLAQATLYGIQSGPRFFGIFVLTGSDMQRDVGFDLFAMERAVEFGNPPATGDILVGDFDTQAVISAHEARGYSSTEANGLTLLCGSKGCDAGVELNAAERDLNNPFGGEMGRNQPVLVGDQMIASSPRIDTVNAIANAIADPGTSLADRPDYRAAAEAITANGTLVQAFFINPIDILPPSTQRSSSDLAPERAKAVIAQLRGDFVPLPPYNLIVIADTATDTEQQALVALVYTSREQAEAAAALAPKHLQDYTSINTRQPMNELMTERGVTSVDASVYPASTDRYVMILTLHAPLPSNAVASIGDMPERSSLVYAVLANAYLGRDLGWLATES